MHLRFQQFTVSQPERRLCHDFVLRKGQESVFRSPPTAASTAITQGEVQKLASGVAGTITSGAKSYGIAMKTKSSGDTSTDPVPVQIIKRGQEYDVPVNTGTFAFATHVGALADVDYAAGEEGKLDLTPSNNDCVVVDGNATNNTAAVTFINTVY